MSPQRELQTLMQFPQENWTRKVMGHHVPLVTCSTTHLTEHAVYPFRKRGFLFLPFWISSPGIAPTTTVLSIVWQFMKFMPKKESSQLPSTKNTEQKLLFFCFLRMEKIPLPRQRKLPSCPFFRTSQISWDEEVDPVVGGSVVFFVKTRKLPNQKGPSLTWPFNLASQS